jgi:ribosomal protein S18 acetylase RimI-like enzyme
MALIVRSAGDTDMDRLVLFNQALARETEGRELDRKTLKEGVEALMNEPARGQYFVAQKAGEVVGQLLVTYEWSDWRNGNIWWVQSVYVSRQHRREGIYRLLHEYARSLARDEKAVGLRLYVDRDNEAAQRTYSALGMQASDYLMFEEMWA